MTIFLQIAGGIALTVFGVRFLRKGLDRLFGGRLVSWLSGLTQRRWRAFFSGVAVGTVAPSSTALALLAMQMLNTGRLTAERMLAVLLGANVGITVTVQLLAFHVQDFAGLFVLAGVIGFQFFHREAVRGVGQCLISLGFIFLAMGMIGDGAAAISADPAGREWVRLFSGHPVLTFLFVAGFTVCVQSSTASIGFAIALAASGLIGADILLPWVLGANAGVALTALAAGWMTLEGKRLAGANLLVKLACALPLLILPAAAGEVFDWLPGSMARQTALFHTGFNILAAVIVMPLLGPVTRFMQFLIVPPPSTGGLPAVQTHLDPQALESPSLALANATRETLAMADGVKLMLQYFWKGYSARDLELAERVQLEDDRADKYYHDIKDYLSRVRAEMTEAEVRWQFALLTFSNELESVGDIIGKNLCDILRRQTAECVWLPDDDYRTLCELYEQVMARFNVAIGLLASQGGTGAREFIAGKEGLNDWCRRAQREHYERLRTTTTVTASAYFVDILDAFRRINSHISAIAYAFSGRPARRRVRGAAEEGAAMRPQAQMGG